MFMICTKIETGKVVKTVTAIFFLYFVMLFGKLFERVVWGGGA